MASEFSRFWTELKRRKVIRAGVVYAVVGIGIIEGAQLIFQALELPDTAWQILTILVLLGFPVALVLAWAVDLTPDGLRREASPPEDGEIPPSQRPSAWARWALAGAVAVVVGLGAFLLFPRQPELPQADGRVPIAVLPFANLSDAEDARAFNNGIHDDIPIPKPRESTATAAKPGLLRSERTA
jgi:hypothetical protein